MTSDVARLDQLIWATRGKSWGFRFLLDGGMDDPLPEYEVAFEGATDAPSAFCRTGDRVAFRFPDPVQRRDAAGRPIVHEFVVAGPLAEELQSVEDGLRKVWPLVADAYARVWNDDTAPDAADLGLRP